MTPTTTLIVPPIRTVIATAVTAALVTLTSAGAHAAFFQLAENSPAALGNAFAGGAAIAEDASTVWYNPAGLTRLNGTQFVVGGYFIKPSLEFDKTSANRATALGGGAISGGNGGDAGENAIVPNFYYAQRLNEGLTFGVGLNVPFGLATDYDDDWVGRYHANRSEIRTININPALGYKVSDALSLGAGISYQKIEAELTQAVDFGSLCALGGAPFAGCAAPGANDGSASVEADDDAWGFNLGTLWQAGEATRIGLAYRSKTKYTLKGTFDVTAPSALAASAGSSVGGIVYSGAQAHVTLPETLSLSAHHVLTPHWTVMGDITRTRWSRLPELRIDFDSSQTDAVTTLDLKDVNRYSVGVNYAPNSTWTYRAGVAIDQTPTPNEIARTPRLPDEDRLWLAFGFGYKSSDAVSFDVSYGYIKVDDAAINKSAGAPGGEHFLRGSLVGNYEADTHILTGQVNWKF